MDTVVLTTEQFHSILYALRAGQAEAIYAVEIAHPALKRLSSLSLELITPALKLCEDIDNARFKYEIKLERENV
jgi:hypothetical protein